jgi:pilus assembly protein Flp/PilA
MKHLIERLIAEDSGQDMIEYGLIAAIVALGTATVIRGLDNSIKNSFSGIGNSLTNAVL